MISHTTGLDLRANITYPCPEENVLFICSTPGSYLRWRIVFSDHTVQYKTIENYDHLIGTQEVVTHFNAEMLFTVASGTNSGSLSSTLRMRSSRTATNNIGLNNTKIECADSTSESFTYYKIPRGKSNVCI